jgi:menaquinone-dependent protoporphyrinogen IX oxidase
VKKILVTYATFAGTTADVARRISEEQVKQGHQATLLPPVQVESLAGYGYDTGAMLNATSSAKPASLALFGGRLNYHRLQ